MNEKDIKRLNKAIKRVVSFIKPIEERYTGMGLPTLFSWLACRTGAGVVCTAPMGGGKTAIAKFIEYLMSESGIADLVINLQEFKKTDWKAILPAHAENQFFHASIPEISAMNKYSQELFWSKWPALQSDGTFEYRYSADGDEDGGQIIFENCSASYFIASQPPKTSAIINDTTFKTLANDRCWNIILINQLRGRKNVDISEIPSIVSKLDLSSGEYTHIIRPRPKKRILPVDFIAFEKINKKGDKATEMVKIPAYYIKFIANGKGKVSHLVDSNLDTSQFEDCIRNQYSVDRREEQMNDILKEWGAFLNVLTIRQVHIDLFVTLFGFYIGLFNSLTVGSVEMSIDIKYGAVEMLCKISALIARNKLVTQHLLTKEFNAKEDDVSYHVSELVKATILQEIKPKGRPKVKRYQKQKSPQATREQTKTLESVGLITKRFANNDDSNGNDQVKPRQAIYEFTDEINGFFKIYASILHDLLPTSILKNVPHINKFLNHGEES